MLGTPHVACCWRLHGLAHYLRGVGNRDQVQIFAQGADQDRLPETLDGVISLSVLVTPVEEGVASVGFG